MLAAIRTRQARSVLPALRSFSTSPASLSDASVPAKSDSQPTSIANPQRAEGAVAQAGVVSGAPGTFPLCPSVRGPSRRDRVRARTLTAALIGRREIGRAHV